MQILLKLDNEQIFWRIKGKDKEGIGGGGIKMRRNYVIRSSGIIMEQGWVPFPEPTLLGEEDWTTTLNEDPILLFVTET